MGNDGIHGNFTKVQILVFMMIHIRVGKIHGTNDGIQLDT
jgi:hypothetical protein